MTNADCGLRIAEYAGGPLRIADCGLRIAEYAGGPLRGTPPAPTLSGDTAPSYGGHSLLLRVEAGP